MPRIAYVNGRYVPHAAAVVHIEDRGLQFADSAYEVIAVMNGHFADEAGHLDRLERSLGELKIALPMPRRALRLVMREFVQRNRLKNASLYMQVTRGAAPRDFKFPANVKPALVMTIRPASFGKLVARKAVTVPDIRWKRRDIKTTALVAQVLAKQAAIEKGAYEALMVDDGGFITEGSSTNAWIVDKSNNLVTRPTQNNMILKGVTRNAMQALCKKEKIKIVERPFTVQEAYQAAEVFTTAAVSLVTPIVEIDGRKIGDGKVGAVTSKILSSYLAYAADPEQKQENWSAR
ncbi:MAG: D-amino-acid transaminase [Alphaproteobacteria bacterium]|nr:D-amino-acid transaminase [Alphaproteobacteria bacterium]